MRRYDALKGPQRAAIAPLPNGYVVAILGQQNVDYVAIVVLDAAGEVKAARKLDGYYLGFLTTSASGEIFAGVSMSHPAPAEERFVRVLKLRSDLTTIWSRRVVSSYGDDVDPRRAAATSDGGVVLAGFHRAASVVVKLNRAGDVEWATQVDPTDRDVINAIVQARDGGYIAAGNSPRHAWLLRFAADGKLLWQRGYAPVPGFRSMVERNDGAIFAVTGLSGIMKLNGRGDVVWRKSASPSIEGGSLVEIGDVVLASFVRGGVPSVAHFLAIGDDGSVKWQRVFRPGQLGFMTMGFEDAMFARSRDRVGFTVPFGIAPLAVFELDDTGGVPNCAWFTDGTLAMSDAPVRDETVDVEVSTLAVIARPVETALAALDVRATPETCEVEPPKGWVSDASLPQPPAQPRKGFDLRKDDEPSRSHFASLFQARKFSELESIAKKRRSEGPSRDPVRPNQALTSFYSVFADDKTARSEVRLQLAREWVGNQPRSSVAPIALARALYKAAWDARGSGYGDTVTATSSAAYDKLLTEARGALDIAKKNGGESDPEYWRVLISLSHELGFADVREVGLRALKLHPDPRIAEDVAQYVGPRWGGSPGIYMKFAEDAARVTASTYGDVMYMWLFYQISVYDMEGNVGYRKYPADWNRVRKGAEELLARAPAWLPSWHRYAILARDHKDDATVQALFLRPELEWYDGADSLWLHYRGYESARRRALDDAFASADVARTPPRLPPPTVQPTRPKKEEVTWTEPIYVVFCRRTSGACVQEMVGAKLISISRSGQRRSFRLALGMPLAPSEIAGAVVVDARGQPFAVATRKSDEKRAEAKFLIDADGLSALIEP